VRLPLLQSLGTFTGVPSAAVPERTGKITEGLSGDGKIGEVHLRWATFLLGVLLLNVASVEAKRASSCASLESRSAPQLPILAVCRRPRALPASSPSRSINPP